MKRPLLHTLNNRRTEVNYFSVAQLIWLVAMLGGSFLFGLYINKSEEQTISNAHQIPTSYHYQQTAQR